MASRHLLVLGGVQKHLYKLIERWINGEDIESFDKYERRAITLYQIGEEKQAGRLYACANNKDHPLSRFGYYCRNRLCPGCGSYISRQYFYKQQKAIKKMRNPKAILFTIYSFGMNDLVETIDLFNEAKRKISRRIAFKQAVRAMSGVIEPKLSEDGQRFAVHSHAAVDVDEDYFDIDELNAIWKKYTHGRGKIEFQWDEDIREGDEEKFAWYGSKEHTWSPEPNFLNDDWIEYLRKGIKSKRLYFHYSPGSSKKKGVELKGERRCA